MNGTELPTREQIIKKQSEMIEGACNADGSWKRGWEPALIQCYVKKDETGVYTVVHNINKTNYSLSISPIKVECNHKIRHQGPYSFTFEAWDQEKNPIDIPFRFAISVLGD